MKMYAPQARKIASSICAIIAFFCLSVCPKIARAQVPVNLAPLVHIQFTDSTGKLLSGGFLYTYSAGTTTRLDTYTDNTGTIQNAWPIPLDATGSPSNASGTQTGIWLTSAAYKFCAYNSAMVQQWCTDGIIGPPFLAGNNAWTGNQTFAGTSIFNGATTLNGGTMAGSFAGSPSFSGAPSFVGGATFTTVAPTFSVSPSFNAGLSTDGITGITPGGTLIVAAANAVSGAGQGIELFAGSGATSQNGGTIFISGGLPGTNGNGGSLAVQGGNGVAGNSAGGNGVMQGGNGVGSGAGGLAKVSGGTGGAFGGSGGDVKLDPGLGSTAATDGRLLFSVGHEEYESAVAPTSCGASGIGASGSCTIDGHAADSEGFVKLVPSGAGIAAAGTASINFNRGMGTGAGGALCVWTLMSNTGTWNARATVIISNAPTSANNAVNWDNNSVALTSGSEYDIAYRCVGRN